MEQDPVGEVRETIIRALAKAIWIRRGGWSSSPQQMESDWREAERQFEELRKVRGER